MIKLNGKKKILLILGVFIILNLYLELSKYFNPLLSEESITFLSSDKCSYRIIAGITWPPEPPVDIKIFFFIFY